MSAPLFEGIRTLFARFSAPNPQQEAILARVDRYGPVARSAHRSPSGC